MVLLTLIYKVNPTIKDYYSRSGYGHYDPYVSAYFENLEEKETLKQSCSEVVYSMLYDVYSYFCPRDIGKVKKNN